MIIFIHQFDVVLAVELLELMVLQQIEIITAPQLSLVVV
jgi:hypothetical protein